MIFFCLKNDIDWKFVERVSVPSSFAVKQTKERRKWGWLKTNGTVDSLL